MGYRIVGGSISRQYSKDILDICKSIDNVKEFYINKRLYKEFNRYVSIAELIAYRSQLEKLKYFKNKSDIEVVYNCLTKRIKKCRIPSVHHLNRYFKERIKCFIIANRYS